MSDWQAHAKVKVGSDRNFGLVLAAGFTLIALLPLLHGGNFRAWAIIVATIFLVPAIFVSPLAPSSEPPMVQIWATPRKYCCPHCHFSRLFRHRNADGFAHEADGQRSAQSSMGSQQSDLLD